MSAAVAGLQGRYGSLRLPVFVVAGRDDRVVDVHRHSERLADEIPSSVLHLVSDAGHMVHYIAPNEIADAIERLGALSSRSPTTSG